MCFCPVCVLLHTAGYVGVYVPVQLCPVVLWPGSCELMRALLSPRLNSSIIHKPPCQQPGWVRVSLCTCSHLCVFRYAYECLKVMAL